ncbi:MAG: hypothetical protein AB7E49_10820 [Campylobacterales bacterium]
MTYFENRFSSYKKRIDEISYDKEHRVSLCKSKQNYFSYDEIIDKQWPTKRISKFDLIHFHEDFIVCVEFKNQERKDINKDKVREKITEGILSLHRMCSGNLAELNNKKIVYFVVYRQESSSRQYLSNHLGSTEDYFSLEQYKGWLLEQYFVDSCSKKLKNKMSEFNIEIDKA